MSVRVHHETYDYLKGSQMWEWHATCGDCHDGLCSGDGREGWEEALTWALGHRQLKHSRRPTRDEQARAVLDLSWQQEQEGTS